MLTSAGKLHSRYLQMISTNADIVVLSEVGVTTSLHLWVGSMSAKSVVIDTPPLTSLKFFIVSAGLKLFSSTVWALEARGCGVGRDCIDRLRGPLPTSGDGARWTPLYVRGPWAMVGVGMVVPAELMTPSNLRHFIPCFKL